MRQGPWFKYYSRGGWNESAGKYAFLDYVKADWPILKTPTCNVCSVCFNCVGLVAEEFADVYVSYDHKCRRVKEHE